MSLQKTEIDDPDGLCVDRLTPWISSAIDPDGYQHIVLSNGWQRIRIDVDDGRLVEGHTFRLHYRLSGLRSAEPKLLPLRRFLDLCRYGRFARSLFPPDRRAARWLTTLQVHDALAAGASQREIGAVLFKPASNGNAWSDEEDWMRSRVRRLVREARQMARGGYRMLLHQRRR